MEEKIVRYFLSELPPIDEEEAEHLQALAARPDSEIDCSDIPELTDERLSRARRRYTQSTREVTLHIDEEVIDWLTLQGDDLATQMNHLLRWEMLKRTAFVGSETKAPAKSHLAA